MEVHIVYGVIIGTLGLLLLIFSIDGVTHLWVRRIYQLVYRALFLIDKRSHCVLIIDIDNFKTINDHFGHKVGDQALWAVARIIRRSAYMNGFRYGGDEFVVLLPFTSLKKAVACAEKIHQQVTEKIRFADYETLRIKVSIGVGRFEQLADKALFRAKQQGKNQVVILGPE